MEHLLILAKKYPGTDDIHALPEAPELKYVEQSAVRRHFAGLVQEPVTGQRFEVNDVRFSVFGK